MRNLFIAASIFVFSACFGISCAAEQNPATFEKKEPKVIPLNKENQTPKYLYRIVSLEEWQKSKKQKVVETSELDKNFIHLATKEQLPQIAQKFWKNKDYVILKLDTKKLTGRLVYEANPGGTTLYYHLYEGTIPLDAVVDASVIRD